MTQSPESIRRRYLLDVWHALGRADRQGVLILRDERQADALPEKPTVEQATATPRPFSRTVSPQVAQDESEARSVLTRLSQEFHTIPIEIAADMLQELYFCPWPSIREEAEHYRVWFREREAQRYGDRSSDEARSELAVVRRLLQPPDFYSDLPTDDKVGFQQDNGHAVARYWSTFRPMASTDVRSLHVMDEIRIPAEGHIIRRLVDYLSRRLWLLLAAGLAILLYVMAWTSSSPQ